MKKHFFKLSFFISIVAFIIASCNNEPAFNKLNENESEKNDLLKTAKEIVQQQNGNVPLPVNGTGSAHSRSAMSLITSGTPLWDYVKYYNIDGMQVLMIELQTAEQVFSRITSTKDGITSTKEVETFSRLVIRKKGTKLYTHVITYMPESEYAMANQAKLDTIGYYPQYVDFTGITLTSHLDGSIFRGIRYENGHVAGIITKPQHTDCDHDHGTCSHSHHDEYTNPININLFTQSSQEPMSREIVSIVCRCGKTLYDGKCQDCGWGFADECPNCKLGTVVDGMCLNCFYNDRNYCPNCLGPIGKCPCQDEIRCGFCGNKESECSCNLPCPNCGKSECNCTVCPDCGKYECDCNVCPKCGYDPCICHLIGPEPIDTCDICKQEPCICCKVCNTFPCVCTCESCGELLKNCICETNTSPISYDPHDNDRLVGLIDECVEPTTCCSMAVLEMAYLIYGGTEMNQGSFAQYYTQFNYMSPEEETVLNYNDSFITHFFETSSLYTMVSAIDSGNVVVVRKNGHYMLVFGLQYDGDVIYADPHEGGIYAVNESYFSGCDAFEIGGINQSRMRMLAQ